MIVSSFPNEYLANESRSRLLGSTNKNSQLTNKRFLAC